MRTNQISQIDAAASTWLIRRDSGAWTAADQARLDKWLSASTLNRVAFLRLELAWEEAARLKALGAGVPGDRPPPPGRWNLTPFFAPNAAECSDDVSQIGLAGTDSARRAAEESPSLSEMTESSTISPVCIERAKPVRLGPRRQTLAAAAVLVVAVGISAYLALAPNGERYATPVGGFASVPMADGSTVTLNTDSQVRIALSDTERRVELGHGEAFFEVSKDPARPFVVHVGSKRVIAVGTKFSVRRDGNEVEIVVTEGKVRVEDPVAGRGGSGADGSAEVFLAPGSIARAGDAGVMVQRKTLPEVEEELSWRTGVLMFRDRTLGEAAAEFNRYNVNKIVIQDSAIASLKIEGNFRATNVEAFVRLLESGFPLRAETHGNQIALMAK